MHPGGGEGQRAFVEEVDADIDVKVADKEALRQQRLAKRK
jgi:hypothetical protein